MQNENQVKYLPGIAPDAEVCGNCKHFHRHFIQAENGGFAEILDGHCSAGRLKNTKQNRKCEKFAMKRTDNERRRMMEEISAFRAEWVALIQKKEVFEEKYNQSIRSFL